MLSLELPHDEAEKLKEIARSQNIPPSDIVKRLVRQYLDAYFGRTTAYDLGKDLFGRYGSAENRSSRPTGEKALD